MKWLTDSILDAAVRDDNDKTVVIGAPITNPDFCEALEESREHTLMTFNQDVEIEKRNIPVLKGLKRVLHSHVTSAGTSRRHTSREEVRAVDSEMGYPA